VASLPVIGTGTLHSVGGYAGLSKGSDYLNLSVPLLLLDIRDRPNVSSSIHILKADTREVDAPGGGGGGEAGGEGMESPARREFFATRKRMLRGRLSELEADLQNGASQGFVWTESFTLDQLAMKDAGVILAESQVEDVEKVALALKHTHELQTALAQDVALGQALAAQGKADIYEVCRLAHLHSLVLQDPDITCPADTKADADDALWEAIEKMRARMRQADSSNSDRLQLLGIIVDHCVQREFESYWQLKSDDEKLALKARGVVTYTQEYADMMRPARTAYYSLLSSELLYTAHAGNLPDVMQIVNQRLLKKDRLPKENSLDGLLMLRAAWDIVDIGQTRLKFFKVIKKAASMS